MTDLETAFQVGIMTRERKKESVREGGGSEAGRRQGWRRKGMLRSLGPRAIQNGSVKGLHGERGSKKMMQQNPVQKIPVSDETSRKTAIIH